MVRQKYYTSAVVKSMSEWDDCTEFLMVNSLLVKIIYCAPSNNSFTAYRGALVLYTDSLTVDLLVLLISDFNW